MYLVHYTPTEGGPHVIDITFDGEQIPDAPIRIFVEAGSGAGIIIVTQPMPNKLGVYTVEHSHSYKLNAAGAGEPALSATSHGEWTGLKPQLNIIDKGDNRYTICLIAAEPDTYHVNIMWGEEHVPGSPFELAVEDKHRPEKVICTGPHFKVGSTKPVILEVDTENAGAGNLSAICYDKKAVSVPVSIKEIKPKNYTLSFVPATTPDIYSLSVLWSDENVRNSPFKVNLIPPNPQKCIITGPEIPLESNKPILLHVDATNAGNGILDAKAIGDSGRALDVDIQEVEPNKFDVYLFPQTLEYHTLDITWGKQLIPGSPFRLNLGATQADAVKIAEPLTAKFKAGQAIRICFDTSEAGRGDLTSTCKGNKVGEIPVKVTARPRKEKYDIRFTPPEPDIYYVNVFWGGSHIKGSPFTINLMPVDVSRVEMIGPTMPQGLGGPVELMLQTQGTGMGKVTAACIGNKLGNVPVFIQESRQDCYQLQFNPPKSDIYTFAVQYGGHDVRGSPFRVNTFSPNASKVKVTEPEWLEISKPLHYKVNTLNAGFGNLIMTCRGERYGTIQLDISEEGTAQYDISFTAHHPDMYKLSIQWSGKEVPGSPFKVNLLPAEADKVKVTDVHIPVEAGSGDLVWVDLDCSKAGQGSLRGEAWGDLVKDIPVDFEKRGLRMFRVKFLTKQADMYHLSVQYGDGHIPGSPFVINLVPPLPDCVKLVNYSIPQEAGIPVALTFDTLKAGKGSLDAKTVGESVGSVPVKVEKLYPTEYKVKFFPPKPDTFKVYVTWADEAVKHSPFTIDTRPKTHPMLVECGEPISTTVGEPVELTVDASKAGPGTITAICSGNEWGLLPVEVKKASEKMYIVTFTPQNVDHYTLSVFYNNAEVKKSPFRINMQPVQKKFRKGIEAKNRELALKDLFLREVRRQKEREKQKVTKAKQSIGQTQKKTIKLVEEKIEVEKQIQLKKEELEFLHTSRQENSEQLQNKTEKIKKLKKRLQAVESELACKRKVSEDLKEKMEVEKQLQLKEEELESLCRVNQKNSEELQNKEAGLATLQKHLHTLQSELTSERKLRQELREKLQHELTKLEKKTAAEQELEHEKQALKTHLEREKKMVDFLQVQLTSTSTSKDQYTREVEVMRHQVQIPNENKCM